MTKSTDKYVGRRDFIKSGVGTVVAAGAAPHIAKAQIPEERHSIKIEAKKTRPWIGPDFWSNRFQDWQLKNGVIECLMGDKGHELRTLGLLTRAIEKPGRKVKLEGVFTPLTGAKAKGFSGFLIGVGAGLLDYRAAALAQRGEGKNGGFMAVVSTSGEVAFRSHSSNEPQLTYEKWKADESNYAETKFVKNGVKLVVEITKSRGSYNVLATAYDPETDKPISYARRKGVKENQILGGISLLSSPDIRKDGSRWSIKELDFSGDKLAYHPERGLGPVMGTMHSLSNGVLKLSAQFMPLGEGDPSRARFQYKTVGSSSWKSASTSPILDGYSALFRVEGWDSSQDWDFRITYPNSDEALWSGTIRKDPKKGDELVAALYSCISSTANSLEGGGFGNTLPFERNPGRFEEKNFYFPHNDLRKNTLAHDPDILLVCGDQYYEGNPIRLGRNNVETRKIDTLYRWYLWYWSFRDIMRNIPTIMLLDDHDVLHGNIWGHAGREAPDSDQNSGGYAFGLDMVHMVHRVQASHNPDAYDDTPVLNDIPVSYGAFLYGGVSFAVVEDRKWKTTPLYGTDLDVHVAQLLGERQETFLAAWKDMHPNAPKILVTASVWGCPQTSPEGKALVDFDSNGYPPFARRKAVQLVKDAGAVMVAGDQHLGTVVRHGIDTYTDGPIQFSGPAGAAYWQRWFEPAKPLPNGRKGVKESGDFIDGFGNKMNIQAVANPKISFAEYRKHKAGRQQSAKDPDVKSEGYGIIRVSKSDESFTFECWPKTEDPTRPNAKQYAGWPYRVGFEDV